MADKKICMPTKVYGHFARREIFFYRTLREVTKLMNYQHISKKTARLTANGSSLSVIPGPSRRMYITQNLDNYVFLSLGINLRP